MNGQRRKVSQKSERPIRDVLGGYPLMDPIANQTYKEWSIYERTVFFILCQCSVQS